MAGEIQHQIPRQSGHVPESRIRPAQVQDGPRLPGRGQADRVMGDFALVRMSEMAT
jgi:hypothetical protein